MWYAQPTISSGDAGWFHVVCPVFGDSIADVQAGAEFILDSLAKGKFAAIRNAPSAEDHRDFDTKIVTYKGHVRFSFRDEPGEWKYPDRSLEGVAMTAFGLGSCTT